MNWPSRSHPDVAWTDTAADSAAIADPNPFGSQPTRPSCRAHHRSGSLVALRNRAMDRCQSAPEGVDSPPRIFCALALVGSP